MSTHAAVALNISIVCADVKTVKATANNEVKPTAMASLLIVFFTKYKTMIARIGKVEERIAATIKPIRLITRLSIGTI